MSNNFLFVHDDMNQNKNQHVIIKMDKNFYISFKNERKERK